MYLGTDPEKFIVNKAGKAIPAFAVGIPDKDHKVKNGAGTASWFYDNYAVEFNTTAPYTCISDVFEEVDRACKKLNRTLSEKGMRLVAQAAIEVDPSRDLKTAPFDMFQFGCSPDFCAYDLMAKKPEIDARTHTERYAGGHLHFSSDNIESNALVYPYCHPMEKVLLNTDNYPEIIRKMDKYLGLAGAYLWADQWQWRRRKWYGQAGRFRPQNYPVAKTGYRVYGSERQAAMGVEYRTLPPQVFDHPQITEMFMAAGRWVIHNFDKIPDDRTMDDFVRLAIDEGKGVESLVQRFAVPKVYDFSHLKMLKSSFVKN